MILTDTHAHLYADEFTEDRDEMLQRAFKTGVERIFLPNIDPSTTEKMNKLVASYPDHCFPMMGLHPGSVGADWEKALEHVREELEKGGYCAVGEIGLDFYWDTTYAEEQRQAFRQQIDLAKEHELPIVIHVRDSFREAFDIVEEMNTPNLRGIFHCFTGDLEDAEDIIALGGFLIGIGGILTFKNAELDNIVEKIGLDHMVLETDAPYLAPDPNRGERNESSYLVHIAERMADVHGTTPKEIAEVTTENSRELFGV
ncbi:MAG: TatD family hydrolase [Flavobacteriales bacterium]